MSIKLKRFGFCWIVGVGVSLSSAQESINTAGGNASGDGGSLSYSVGQVAYQSYETSDGSLSEGVQQVYDISVETAIKNTQNINLTISSFQNSASDDLVLNIDGLEKHDINYQIYDIKGKLIQRNLITNSQTVISMSSFASAIYFVKITDNNTVLKSFRVIKK